MAKKPSLAPLEKAVKRAVQKLSKLTAENRKLADRNESLEKKLVAAKAKKKAGAGRVEAPSATSSPEARQRLESLEKELAALLEA